VAVEPRIVIGIVLIAHGIGHSMGILGVSEIAKVNPSWQGDSWILTDRVGRRVARVVGVALWATAMIGFVALGATVFGWMPDTWWRPLAIASSIASIAGLVLFPTAFPIFSSMGAFAIDAAVLVATLWYGWGPGALAS
jgi:hypothetical protein